ncbi:MAG: LamG-like jellyroll fold domain-containing protein [Bacteroidota bacterium]|nr:LamG-like jellyroll fold domain-containing protein [Bacteroidota bacterium]
MSKSIILSISLVCLLSFNTNAQSCLVAEYLFSGNANDNVGNNHGTVFNVALCADRFNNPNSAYNFNGSTSTYISLPTTNFVNNQFSYSMWVNVNSLPASGSIGFMLSIGSANSSPCQNLNVQNQYFSTTNTWGGGGYNVTTPHFGLETNSAITLGQWYHIASVRGSNYAKYFVNGVMVDSIGNATPLLPDYGSIVNAFIGKRSNNSTPIDAKIDDVQIYNCALTNSQVATLYTVQAQPTATAPASALHLNGSSDNVIVNHHASLNMSITDAFTVETWFKTTHTGQESVISKMADIPPYTGYDISVQFGKLTFAYISAYSSSCIFFDINPIINDGNWHHVAVVYKGIPSASTIAVYLDGVSQTKNIIVDNLSSSINTTLPFTIGSRNNTAFYFSGSLDETRVWRRALCQSEILAHKNCELVGNEPNLVAYYKYNQGIAAGNNTTISILNDVTATNSGTLTNFTLNGPSSNFIVGTTSITGTCGNYGGLSVVGTSTLCRGQNTTLTANGAITYTWNTNSTNTTIAVSPTVTTTYTVYGTDAGNCVSRTSYTVSVFDCTGLNNLNTNGANISIYPNPTQNGLLTIKGAHKCDVVITNAVGQIVDVLKNSNETVEIDLSEKAAGIYFIQLRSENNTSTFKVIKE